MKATDIKPGIEVKLQNGTIFIIESIENGFVRSSLKGGSKNNYRTELNDAVDFFNEEKAIIL